MPARTFQDSEGTVWEVFEVRRQSEAPRGVSEGLEGGWLTFASESGKRRLAPFPGGWERAAPSELEEMCAQAREANATRFRREPRPEGSRITQELIARDDAAATHAHQSQEAADAVSSDAEPIRADIRAFARQARADRLSAVEAMVRLKAELLERYGSALPAQRAIARDLRSIRRWFVEAFYFEHER